MAQHNDFGNLAEEMACKFLEDKNYKIIAKNYRYLKAEIDIIAEFEDNIIIVEVKARDFNALIKPEEAVNSKKIKLIVSATNHFLEENNWDKEVRFDIISIFRNSDKSFKINHFENAFEAIDI